MGRTVLSISPQSDADGICQSQTLSSGGTQSLTINGALSASGSILFDSPHIVTITSAGNDSSRTFIVTGTDARGTSITESVTGGNAGTVVTTLYFLSVSGITIDGNSAAALTVGVDGRASSKWGAIDFSGVNIGFGCEMSTSSNFTYSIQHTFGDIQNTNLSGYKFWDHERVAGVTESMDHNYAFGFTGVRAVITSYTSGTLEVTLIAAER